MDSSPNSEKARPYQGKEESERIGQFGHDCLFATVNEALT